MTSKQWQLADDAASRYEEVLVPTILGPFARALVDWADLQNCRLVVDVGCGTGAAARFAAAKIGVSGKVIGTDVNPSMLRVAQSLPDVDGAPIKWRQESAYALGMNDDASDAVLCAQTLQFLDQRLDGLREMRRILKPDGSLYLSLWCDIDQNPYFDNLVSMIATYIGEDTAAGLGSAFNLTNLDEIQDVLHNAGFSEMKSTVAERTLPLPPIAEFAPRHICATPMEIGYMAAPASTQQAILHALSARLAQYQTASGLCVPFRSHLIQVLK